MKTLLRSAFISAGNTVSVRFLTPASSVQCVQAPGNIPVTAISETPRHSDKLEVYRRRCEHRISSSSASNEPLASHVPFPSLHTSSHLFSLLCDTKRPPERGGEGEGSKAAAGARSGGCRAGAALESRAPGEACAPLGSCKGGSALGGAHLEGAVRGQLYRHGANTTTRCAASAPGAGGAKVPGISASPQRAQPRERGGQNPSRGQSREKKNESDLQGLEPCLDGKRAQVRKERFAKMGFHPPQAVFWSWVPHTRGSLCGAAEVASCLLW